MKYALILTFMLGIAAGACSSSASLPACPTADKKTTLTYANFGQNFVSTYCTRYNSEYGSLSDIKSNAGDIVEKAGTGTEMPESGAKPTSDERAKLTEWLACGGN